MGFRKGSIQWLIAVSEDPDLHTSQLCCSWCHLHPKAPGGFFIHIQYGRRETGLSPHSQSPGTLSDRTSLGHLWADHGGQGLVRANRSKPRLCALSLEPSWEIVCPETLWNPQSNPWLLQRKGKCWGGQFIGNQITHESRRTREWRILVRMGASFSPQKEVVGQSKHESGWSQRANIGKWGEPPAHKEAFGDDFLT